MYLTRSDRDVRFVLLPAVAATAVAWIALGLIKVFVAAGGSAVASGCLLPLLSGPRLTTHVLLRNVVVGTSNDLKEQMLQLH